VSLPRFDHYGVYSATRFEAFTRTQSRGTR